MLRKIQSPSPIFLKVKMNNQTNSSGKELYQQENKL